jgi:hypothetical protein
MRFRFGFKFLRIALASTLAASSPAAFGREQLRVRAGAEFVNLGLVRAPGGTELSGGLSDEVGQPIADAEIVLPVPEDVGERATSCRSGDRVRSVGAAVVATTDGLGFFCIRLTTDAGVDGATLGYGGDRYHASARAPVPKETGKRQLVLAFESPALIASLDSPSFVTAVTARTSDDAKIGDSIRLVLSQERNVEGGAETELAATDVQIGGTARFDVETRILGAPGAGRLIVRFAGSGSLAPASESALLERRAAAHLTLAATVSPADPTDGVEILVGAHAATGAVTDGWVEASVLNQPAGLAPVIAGAARVIATFSPVRGHASTVMLRYVSTGNGIVGGETLSVDVPIRPPSPWLSLPWLLVGGIITYFVVRAWRRPARTARPRATGKDGMGHGRASVEVVETDASHSGWRGRVIDAHEGTPVAGARVSIVVPAFDGEGIAASYVAGADGAFALMHVEAARNEGARLVVTAPFHSTLSGPTPPDGVLTVCLLSRRRALLDRLVGWASRAGRPWARRKEPTPLEIAEVARHRREPEVAGWAAEVDEAAYGPRPPDERREHDIVTREPPSPTEAHRIDPGDRSDER